MGRFLSIELALAATTLFSAVPQVHAQQWLNGQLSEVISAQATLFRECTSFVKTCPATIATCASALCKECTAFSNELKNCCAQADPPSCFASYNAANGGSGGGTITASASAAAPGGSGSGSGCGPFSSIFGSCEAATPGFSSLNDQDAASCLCYQGATWMPDVFDGAIMTCANALSAAGDVSDYSGLATIEDFCSSVGDVMSGAAQTSTSVATTTRTTAHTTSAGSATHGSAFTASTATPTATTTGNAAPGQLKGSYLSMAGLLMVALFS